MRERRVEREMKANGYFCIHFFERSGEGAVKGLLFQKCRVIQLYRIRDAVVALPYDSLPSVPKRKISKIVGAEIFCVMYASVRVCALVCM